MDLNVNTLVRSAVILAIGLPVSLSVSSSVNSNTARGNEVAPSSVLNEKEINLKSSLFDSCIKYAFSKPDSAVETEAKNTINKVMGGDVAHVAVCKYVL